MLTRFSKFADVCCRSFAKFQLGFLESQFVLFSNCDRVLKSVDLYENTLLFSA